MLFAKTSREIAKRMYRISYTRYIDRNIVFFLFFTYEESLFALVAAAERKGSIVKGERVSITLINFQAIFGPIRALLHQADLTIRTIRYDSRGMASRDHFLR